MSIVTILRLKYYLARVRSASRTVLHYNRQTDRLEVWPWPSKDKAHVHPSDLCEYREEHEMRGPGCMCSMLFKNLPDYVEAAIYEVTSGPLSGEYVATCAQNRCGYFVWLERLYDKNGVPIKQYPERERGKRVPPVERNFSGPLNLPPPLSSLRGLERTRAVLDVMEDYVPALPAPVEPFVKTATHLLLRLDSHVRAGITEDEFYRLFVRCSNCGLIMTKRVFDEHVCPNELIDLTFDDSD